MSSRTKACHIGAWSIRGVCLVQGRGISWDDNEARVSVVIVEGSIIVSPVPPELPRVAPSG
eukprot:502270-Lingulodinium_polyedra.AAC.1